MVQNERNKKSKERIDYINGTEKIVVIAKCVEIIQTCEKECRYKECYSQSGDHESSSCNKHNKSYIPIGDHESSSCNKHNKSYIPTGDHESSSCNKHNKCYIPTGDHESSSCHKHNKCYIPTGDHESSSCHKHNKCYIPTGDHESCSSHKHQKCCIPICDSESSSNHKHKECCIPICDHQSSIDHGFCHNFKKKKSKISADGLDPAVHSEVSNEEIELVVNSIESVQPDATETNDASTDNIISVEPKLFEEISIPHIFPVKSMPSPLVKRVN
jgi:hypothetical protein